MKSKICMLIAMLSICSIAFAQFTGDGQYSSSVDDKAGKFGFCYELAFGYVMPQLNGAKKYAENKFSGSIVCDFGARYFFTNQLYAEGMIGYKYINEDVEYKILSEEFEQTYDIHNITIPIHGGFKYSISDKFGIGVHAGPRIDIPVVSSCKRNKAKYDTDIPVTVLIEGGLDFILSEEQNQNLRLQFGYSPSEKNEYSVVSIGYSYMF